MARLIVEPTAKAALQRLLIDAQNRTHTQLDEAHESYLVFLLLRYLRRPDLVRTVLALRFLRGVMATGRVRAERLQDVGDQCLLYAGLFPDQAARRRVRLGYFTDLGRSAYGALAEQRFAGCAEFAQLAADFTLLADVLQAARLIEGKALDPLAAAEAWADTGSELGRQELRRHTEATPAPGSTRSQ